MQISEQTGYLVTAKWEAGRKGVVSAEGVDPSIRFSSPPEFKGESGFWTPEHFLVAAVASCYVVTFYAIADISKLDFLGLELSIEGKLGKLDGKLRFTEIVMRPILTIVREEDRQRANRLLEKAEQGCLVARSLSCPVTTDTLVRQADEILAL
jgi:peroxiredoxin-like protein